MSGSASGVCGGAAASGVAGAGSASGGASVLPFADGEVYTVAEVAQRLRLGRRAVRSAVHRGELAASRPGRQLRVLGCDANAWWQAARVSAAPSGRGPLASGRAAGTGRAQRPMPVLR